MAAGRLVYLNGELVEHEEAKVSVEDRGFNFADGIYEVVRIVRGRGFRIECHAGDGADERDRGGDDLPSAHTGRRAAHARIS
jgi:hypothetical protein